MDKNVFSLKNIGGYEFIEFNCGNMYGYFSTAKGGLCFNKNTPDGIENLNNLKKWFGKDKLSYLSQIHSDITMVADDNIYEGDGLITHESNRIIGVFTADCVPIILMDEEHRCIAAVHSGWKGTAKNIVVKSLKKMESQYGTKPQYTKVFIGPHINKCCFQVGSEVIEEFQKNPLFNSSMVINESYIDLYAYIKTTLIDQGIKEDNIYNVDVCTYCNTDFSLHSYRRHKKGYGRMFSFAFIK
ncbi:conserved hypothetical protein [Hathewaya proteolytica DSM 3090]|uniref:Purine nucleoside phosphorylase n=1 Tax=Hathewaya proteolytica DSM 3090 TaxID=1121331 RepID=A0A1M6JBZ8_9CLOT|nr:peptidoglycan editing factor PgeF [Hathewaya proteolytica]SHJ44134.1 conserved hypothetical protein [Hathewaya proteolytica DSM 3090]